MSDRTFVGLDVHARSTVGYALNPGTGEVCQRRMGADPLEVLGWLRSLSGEVLAGYEAGPTGYGLQRFLQAGGVPAVVLAPSKIARPAGDKVKTDLRDAQLLAQHLAMGEYVAVRVPTVGQEAARDLWRARAASSQELARAKHRIGKYLLRRGIVYPGKSTWTKAHLQWLRTLAFTEPIDTAVYSVYLEDVLLGIERLSRLDADLAPLAATSEYAAVIARLKCLRGLSTISSYGLATEIGDWHRFTGRSIGAYLGLVPSEHSSGQTRSQGPITRAGNRHARRLLIEAAWIHHRPYRMSTDLLERMNAVSVPVRTRAQQANRRLARRWQSFDARKKNRNQANTAIARELAAWCWSLAVMPD